MQSCAMELWQIMFGETCHSLWLSRVLKIASVITDWLQRRRLWDWIPNKEIPSAKQADASEETRDLWQCFWFVQAVLVWLISSMRSSICIWRYVICRHCLNNNLGSKWTWNRCCLWIYLDCNTVIYFRCTFELCIFQFLKWHAQIAEVHGKSKTDCWSMSVLRC